MADDGFNATVDCPDFDESGSQLLEDLGYWMEGIAQCSIAVLGIMFNIGSSLVLASRWVTDGLTMANGNFYLLVCLFKQYQFLSPAVMDDLVRRGAWWSRDDFCAIKESC